MNQSLAHVTYLVRDYDEAITFFTEKLHFNLIEDTVLSEVKRWVRVAPPGESGCCLLLAKAVGEEQVAHIGNQAGRRVFLFLYTDDFERDFSNLKDNGIAIVRDPSFESYGIVAVFRDLYGNLWDLIQPKK
jgi:catechol 2,3-dioxygenase-like lactoylglutathione lyase family enzyme